MIKFYSNKELSQAFKINLAKWKRWSREFLPPDPLGGLQSGFARQYNLDEAFTVYLGGYLVGKMKFTIPESKQILRDLQQWLIDHGIYFDYLGQADPEINSTPAAQNYRIAIISSYISKENACELRYRIKATLAEAPVQREGRLLYQEQFMETLIPAQKNGAAFQNSESYRVLNISRLRRNFLANFQSMT